MSTQLEIRHLNNTPYHLCTDAAVCFNGPPAVGNGTYEASPACKGDGNILQGTQCTVTCNKGFPIVATCESPFWAVTGSCQPPPPGAGCTSTPESTGADFATSCPSTEAFTKYWQLGYVCGASCPQEFEMGYVNATCVMGDQYPWTPTWSYQGGCSHLGELSQPETTRCNQASHQSGL